MHESKCGDKQRNTGQRIHAEKRSQDRYIEIQQIDTEINYIDIEIQHYRSETEIGRYIGCTYQELGDGGLKSEGANNTWIAHKNVDRTVAAGAPVLDHAPIQ